MFRFGLFALMMYLPLVSGIAQSSTQVYGVSVIGTWSNAVNPAEHFELSADGGFALDENGQHFDGTWELYGPTLALHLTSSQTATAQWDGHAFIDSQQKRWVRTTSGLAPATPASNFQSAAPAAIPAQSGSQTLPPLQALNAALTSHFALTKLTADGSDIVTAGSVLVLHKDGLLMFSIDTKVPPTNTYKAGKISIGFGSGFATDLELAQLQPGASAANVPQRKFVAGEKFWIVAFTAKDDGVVFRFYSDPYSDIRYYGQLKIPFQKHVVPPVDDVLKTIFEVVTVQQADNPPNGVADIPPSPSPASVQEPRPEPIPPPPPPADAPAAPPKTIALGQTVDQVVANFGQPQKVVKLGAKEIYYYSDMKVTFVNGKVTDVQ